MAFVSLRLLPGAWDGRELGWLTGAGEVLLFKQEGQFLEANGLQADTIDLRNSISHLLTFFRNRKPLRAVARAPL